MRVHGRQRLRVVVYSPVRPWLDDVAWRLGIAAPLLHVVKAESRAAVEAALANPETRCVVFALMGREAGGWLWMRELDLACPTVEMLAQGELPMRSGDGETGTVAHRWIRDGSLAELKELLKILAARKRGPKPAGTLAKDATPMGTVLPLTRPAMAEVHA